MSAVLRAVTWEFWRENRWWIIIAMCVILGLMSTLYNDPKSEYDSGNDIHFTVFILEMLAFGKFLCLTQYNKNKSRLGFPELLFVKPVSMPSVALIRLGLAVVTAVSLYLLTAWTFCLATHLMWPIFLPCLYMAALIIFVHTMAWSLPAAPALQILFAAIGYIVLCIRYYNDLHSTANSARVFGLLVFIAISTSLALAGAVLDRRAQRLSFAALWNWIVMICTSCLPWKTCPGKTPQQAMFWFHWIRKGWVLPLINIIAIITGVGLLFGFPNDKEEILDVYYSTFFIINLFVFPFLAGLIVCQQETRNQGMPVYVGYLPVSNRSMLWIYTRTAFISLALSWTIYLVGLGLLYTVLTITGHGHLTNNLWSHLREIGGAIFLDIRDENTGQMLTIHGIYILLAWAAIGFTGSMMLTGRRNVVVTAIVVIFLLLSIPDLAEEGGASKSIVNALYRIEAWLFILVSIGGTVAAFVYGTLKKRISLYLTVAAVLGFILLNLINFYVIWANPSILESLVLLAVLALPLAPFATAPLALAWNRHR